MRVHERHEWLLLQLPPAIAAIAMNEALSWAPHPTSSVPDVVLLIFSKALADAGVEVTLVDANHCPGAVQFLFQLPDGGARYVHCGDMRFCAALKEDAHLKRFVGARAVFLDTTYCNPRFTFPLQVLACQLQAF